MDKLPKVAMPLIILIIVLIVFVSKSTLTIGSGKAGVLYKTFENGVVTDQPPLGEGFHIIAPWNKVFIYEVRQQEVFEKMQVLSSNGLEIKLDASAWFEPKYEFLGNYTKKKEKPMYKGFYFLRLDLLHVPLLEGTRQNNSILVRETLFKQRFTKRLKKL